MTRRTKAPAKPTADSIANEATSYNKTLYDDVWRYFPLEPHTIWASTWKEIEPFTHEGQRMLEIGPGKWPHVPASRAHFLDLSNEALCALRAAGGTCTCGATPLPYDDSAFDLVCFFEVLEHVGDDAGFLAEVARVLRPGGILFLSCPMNTAYWTHYDKVVGHVRRYAAPDLRQKIEAAGFTIERVGARHDRMNRAFGWLLGFMLRRFTRLTAALVRWAAHGVAEKPYAWVDEQSLDLGERRGGVTLRARRRPF